MELQILKLLGYVFWPFNGFELLSFFEVIQLLFEMAVILGVGVFFRMLDINLFEVLFVGISTLVFKVPMLLFDFVSGFVFDYPSRLSSYLTKRKLKRVNQKLSIVRGKLNQKYSDGSINSVSSLGSVSSLSSHGSTNSVSSGIAFNLGSSFKLDNPLADFKPAYININNSVETRLFEKIGYHGTTMEAAREILEHNLWVVSENAIFKGIHFANFNYASLHGKVLVKVKVQCPENEVSDNSLDTTATLIRMDDNGNNDFHYFIPTKFTGDGERFRPKILTPLELIDKSIF